MLLLIASLGLATASEPAAPASAVPVELADAGLSIRERIIVRVQRAIHPSSKAAPPPAQKWKEKKGPKCVPAGAIAAAAIAERDSVDIMLRGGTRLRAELESACPALDYYSGFYVSPTSDGRICADRDSIRDRAGSECEIERFRTLVPAK